DPDVMGPDHHHADSGAAGIGAFVRPRACQREATVRFAEILAQITAAPSVRPMTMPVLGTCLGLNRRKDDQERRNDKERLLHRLLHVKLIERKYKSWSNLSP